MDTRDETPRSPTSAPQPPVIVVDPEAAGDAAAQELLTSTFSGIAHAIPIPGFDRERRPSALRSPSVRFDQRGTMVASPTSDGYFPATPERQFARPGRAYSQPLPGTPTVPGATSPRSLSTPDPTFTGPAPPPRAYHHNSVIDENLVPVLAGADHLAQEEHRQSRISMARLASQLSVQVSEQPFDLSKRWHLPEGLSQGLRFSQPNQQQLLSVFNQHSHTR
jgi:hypothetical protein